MFDARYIKEFRSVKTPFYFYDVDLLERTLSELIGERDKYDNYIVHYAIKANNNEKLLKRIFSKGIGADCVSGNEVLHCVDQGLKGDEIAFAGVGKTDEEIRVALSNDIFSFNCESIPEIEVINDLAKGMGKLAPVAIRINPDIDPKTHRYITTGLKDNKFGINHKDFDEVGRKLRNLENIELKGIHFHTGSQITDIDVFRNLSLKVNGIREWFDDNGFHLEHINVGGGFGIDYHHPIENPIPDFAGYFATFNKNLHLRRGQHLHFELGRSIVGQCGSIITKVLYKKLGIDKKFLIVDAGMNDLARPSLYQAYHKILALTAAGVDRTEKYDVVGPVCESADVFAEDLDLPVCERGDLLAILSAGAYGQTMSSTYNMRKLIGAVYSDEL
ncbi:MAG: diaminopimelate decarboxylase [Bacteroidales bacterium]